MLNKLKINRYVHWDHIRPYEVAFFIWRDLNALFHIKRGNWKISKILTQWEKEYLGRGSVLVKTDIMRNMIIVGLKGILTLAEPKIGRDIGGYAVCKAHQGRFGGIGKRTAWKDDP